MNKNARVRLDGGETALKTAMRTTSLASLRAGAAFWYNTPKRNAERCT